MFKFHQYKCYSYLNGIRWNDTLEDGDRKRRRQAEFLVHQFLPFDLIESIGVFNPATAAQVIALLPSLKHQPTVTVEPKWYY